MKKIAICFLMIICGCQYLKPQSPQVVTILESEFFPVKVDVNGVAFDKMSIIDLMVMRDWSEVKITPTRKGDKDFTHYLVTPRAIEKLRPKTE